MNNSNNADERGVYLTEMASLSLRKKVEILDLKKIIKFYPDKIFREMLSDKPEMRIALMCLEPGQRLEPHKAPMRLLMYCVEGKGIFTVGDEEIEADEKTCILCDPMVPHGFRALDERFVVMAVVTPAEE